jgi:hypothetical protein
MGHGFGQGQGDGVLGRVDDHCRDHIAHQTHHHRKGFWRWTVDVIECVRLGEGQHQGAAIDGGRLKNRRLRVDGDNQCVGCSADSANRAQSLGCHDVHSIGQRNVGCHLPHAFDGTRRCQHGGAVCVVQGDEGARQRRASDGESCGAGDVIPARFTVIGAGHQLYANWWRHHNLVGNTRLVEFQRP